MLARSIRQRPDDDRPHLDRLRDALAEVIKVSPWPLATEGRAVIALVGPAGVGKTTTIAKLAAHARMASRSITLISCDGVRVGAVEQLQRYASLLGAGFATAGTREELADCIDEADSDLVFVDTAGSPPKPDGMESMLATASFGRRPFTRHVLLCLPAALRAQDATATVRAFAALEPTALAITKLDETSTPSGLVHGTIASQLPVAVLCAGQSVPEHIAQATMTAILDQVMPRPAPRGAQA
jgi:flagellar biosynthesis protein FlhF